MCSEGSFALSTWAPFSVKSKSSEVQHCTLAANIRSHFSSVPRCQDVLLPRHSPHHSVAWQSASVINRRSACTRHVLSETYPRDKPRYIPPWTGKPGSRLAVPMHDPEIGSGTPGVRCMVVVEHAYFQIMPTIETMARVGRVFDLMALSAEGHPMKHLGINVLPDVIVHT